LLIFVAPKINTRLSEISLSNSYHGGWNVFEFDMILTVHRR